MSGWIEPSNRTLVAEYWLTRKEADASPGYAGFTPDIRVRYRWNGQDSWFTGRFSACHGAEPLMVCLHSNNGWRLEDDTPIPNCAAVPVVAEREANCREPWHWDDGVPYCDTCGLFRDTIARQGRRAATSKAGA